MFRVKTKNIKASTIIEKLDIIETNDYEYVLADSVDLFENDKINILFNENNLDDIKQMVKLLLVGEAYYINVENSLGIKRVNVRDIEYFEAFDNEVFAIIGKERFYVIEKLYILETTLEQKNFVRVSKSVLVNIAKIDFIRHILNYKLKLVMMNKNIVEVNRTYVKTFKEKMNI